MKSTPHRALAWRWTWIVAVVSLAPIGCQTRRANDAPSAEVAGESQRSRAAYNSAGLSERADDVRSLLVESSLGMPPVPESLVDNYVAPVGQLWIIATETPEARGPHVEDYFEGTLELLELTGDSSEIADAKVVHGIVGQTSIRGQLDGPFATWTLSQTFDHNSMGLGPARYRLSYSQRATVHQFVLKFGSKTEQRQIRAIVAPKERAEAIYRQATSLGLLASISTSPQYYGVLDFLLPTCPGPDLQVEVEFFSPVVYQDHAWTTHLVLNRRWMESIDVDLSLPPGSRVDPIGIDRLDVSSTPHQTRVVGRLPDRHPGDGIEEQTASILIRTAQDAAADRGRIWLHPSQDGGTLCAVLPAPLAQAFLAAPPKDAPGALWLRKNGTLADVFDLYPKKPIVYRPGLPLVVTARYQGDPPAALTAPLSLADPDAHARFPLDVQPLDVSRGSTWVRWVHASNHAHHVSKSDLEKAKEVALESGIISPWTAFLFALAR